MNGKHETYVRLMPDMFCSDDTEEMLVNLSSFVFVKEKNYVIWLLDEVR